MSQEEKFVRGPAPELLTAVKPAARTSSDSPTSGASKRLSWLTETCERIDGHTAPRFMAKSRLPVGLPAWSPNQPNTTTPVLTTSAPKAGSGSEHVRG